jgi:hypothetical protein
MHDVLLHNFARSLYICSTVRQPQIKPNHAADGAPCLPLPWRPEGEGRKRKGGRTGDPRACKRDASRPRRAGECMPAGPHSAVARPLAVALCAYYVMLLAVALAAGHATPPPARGAEFMVASVSGLPHRTTCVARASRAV